MRKFLALIALLAAMALPSRAQQGNQSGPTVTQGGTVVTISPNTSQQGMSVSQTGSDFIQLDYTTLITGANVQLQVFYRIDTTTGTINGSSNLCIASTSLGPNYVTTPALPQGKLQAVTVFSAFSTITGCSGSPTVMPSGQGYLQAGIVQTGTPPATQIVFLICNNLQTAFSIEWSGSMGTGCGIPAQQPGYMRLETPANPGANSLVFTFANQASAQARIKIRGINFTYTSDATAGSRNIQITVSNGSSGNAFQMVSPGAQAASLTGLYNFAAGVGPMPCVTSGTLFYCQGAMPFIDIQTGMGNNGNNAYQLTINSAGTPDAGDRVTAVAILEEIVQDVN